MLNFKILQWATLFSLLVIALGGCTKETDPCASQAERPAYGNQFGIALQFNLWDTEQQTYYTKPLAHIHYHIWRNGQKIEYPHYRVGASDTTMHLLLATANPFPAGGDNAYQMSFVIKFPEYEESDSVSVVAYIEEEEGDCESASIRYEYYLNGDLVSVSSPWADVITLSKP
jgi:hypothetical protein